ncbi:MAG: carboxypeptidase M32 [Gorillibacterium sp.]|nr:carboxypeptidase M32 [Gorillibacterium sp.]
MSEFEQKKSDFHELISRMKSFSEAVGLMYWDLRTGAPKKGLEQRSEAIGLLSTEVFKMSTSAEMEDFLTFFEHPDHEDELDHITLRMVEESRKEFDRSKKIPAERYREYVTLTSQSESAWEEAKHNSDYSHFEPYLDKIIAFNREFIELWGYEDHPYNTLLDIYEPGLTVKKLDEVFGTLRERLVPLVQAVKESDNKPDAAFLSQFFNKEGQKEFNRYILGEIGYDFEAGRVDETEHPFATGLNLGDVRITTRYKDTDFTFALFSTIHECGHALYEQNISPELAGTILCEGTSMGIHESQSRFWENMIGRSESFWTHYYGKLQKQFPKQMDDISLADFYRAINESKPSLIRIEADELTYNLHIMIRYELEKEIFSGNATAKDLPELWNNRYREYLGVVADSDEFGILQDVHWAGGSFGYFPSYALGNMYAAQFAQTMRKDLPQMDKFISEGNFGPIKEWLTERIYQHGKLMTPTELVVGITGEELNPVYLADYLEEKFKNVYKLQ